MLNSMRDAAKSWIVVVLLALLGLAVALTGGFGAFTGGLGNDVAVVGDERIKQLEMRRAWAEALRRLRFSEENRGLTEADARANGLHRQLLSDLVSRAQYRQEAEALGVTATDAEIIAIMSDIEAFVDPVTGRFDPVQARQILAQNRINEDDFTAEIADDIRRQHISAFVTSGAAPPEYLSAVITASIAQERLVSVVIVPQTAITDPAAPDEESLRAFYEANIGRYQTPERRALTLAAILPDTEAAAAALEPSLVEDAVQAAMADATEPETRSLTEIPAPDEATARQVVERLRAGETPEDVVAALGLVGVNPYTDVTAADLPDAALAMAAFAVDEGAVTEPVETTLSWSVAQITGVTAAVRPDDAIVRAQVISDLTDARAQADVAAAGREFERALIRSTTLAEAAEGLSAVTLATIAAVDRSGRDAQGDPVAVLSRLPEALETAFGPNQRIGLATPLLAADSGAQYALQLTAIAPPEPLPFEDVRETITQTLMAQERQNALTVLSGEVQAALESGLSHTDAAAIAGADARTEVGVISQLRPPPGGLSRAAVAAILNPQNGPGAVVAASTDAGETALIRIEALLPEAGSELGPMRGMFQGQIAAGLSQDLLTLYNRALYERHQVRTNPEAFDRAVGASAP